MAYFGAKAYVLQTDLIVDIKGCILSNRIKSPLENQHTFNGA
jgi:hypothetical protein